MGLNNLQYRAALHNKHDIPIDQRVETSQKAYLTPRWKRLV